MQRTHRHIAQSKHRVGVKQMPVRIRGMPRRHAGRMVKLSMVRPIWDSENGSAGQN